MLDCITPMTDKDETVAGPAAFNSFLSGILRTTCSRRGGRLNRAWCAA